MSRFGQGRVVFKRVVAFMKKETSRHWPSALMKARRTVLRRAAHGPPPGRIVESGPETRALLRVFVALEVDHPPVARCCACTSRSSRRPAPCQTISTSLSPVAQLRGIPGPGALAADHPLSPCRGPRSASAVLRPNSRATASACKAVHSKSGWCGCHCSKRCMARPMRVRRSVSGGCGVSHVGRAWSGEAPLEPARQGCQDKRLLRPSVGQRRHVPLATSTGLRQSACNRSHQLARSPRRWGSKLDTTRRCSARVSATYKALISSSARAFCSASSRSSVHTGGPFSRSRKTKPARRGRLARPVDQHPHGLGRWVNRCRCRAAARCRPPGLWRRAPSTAARHLSFARRSPWPRPP